MRKERKCLICGKVYNDHPALSRKDNKTEICPECGTKEAMKVFFENVAKEWSKDVEEK